MNTTAARVHFYVRVSRRADAYFAQVVGVKHAKASSTSAAVAAAARAACKALGISEDEVFLMSVDERADGLWNATNYAAPGHRTAVAIMQETVHRIAGRKT